MQATTTMKPGWKMPAVMLAGCALLLPGMASAQQFSGAIYTSTPDGTTVNANLFPSKDVVYLNGGPQNANAAGLPLGTYYFQVTNPSGSVLLSTDLAVCRQVQVLSISGKGVIYGAAPAPASAPCTAHVNGTNNPANGSIPVQLLPYDDTPNNGGEYKVWLIRQTATTSIGADGKTLNFAGGDTKTDNFKVLTPDGGNNPPPTTYKISGYKFYDANVDGSFDTATEVGIQGYKIELSGTDTNGGPVWVDTTTVFNPLGQYNFMGLNAGSYSVCEVIPKGGQTWVPTTATTLGPIAVGPDSAGNNFGNVCLGAGNGFTLGFWSNNNGQAILKNNDLAWRNLLNGLNLRNANGSDYDVDDQTKTRPAFATAYSNFRTWLLGATATNMAYMLSAQLATMELNVAYGGNSGKPVSAGAFVYAGTAPAGCVVPNLKANGFITIGDLMTAADTASNYSLANNANTTASGAARNCQEFMKTTLDKANNNLNFVADASACSVVYSGTEARCSAP